MRKKTYDRMIRSLELGLAALAGSIVSNLVYTLWGSDKPYSFIGISFIVLFILVVMIMMFIFYTVTDKQ